MHLGRLTPAVVVTGLVLVSAAGAANSVTIVDPAGDAGSGTHAPPDVTSVVVSNDESGTLTFRIALANRTMPFTDDEVCVNLDLDQDPDTGTVEYGADAALCYEGSFEVADGRGATADTFRVYRRGHLISTRAFDLEPAEPLAYYYVQWPAPRTGRGPFKFCVTSTDAAGNQSNTACAPIVLR